MTIFLCDDCGEKYSHEPTAKRCCKGTLSPESMKADRIRADKKKEEKGIWLTKKTYLLVTN